MPAPHLAAVEALAVAIETQGRHAPGHLSRARAIAAELGRRLGWSAAELETLDLAALLHDAGELAVPQSIPANFRDFTPTEFEKMQTHSSVGALIAQSAGMPPHGVQMVRGHHERWDGTGHPDGLRGDAIPLGSRILAVADCLAGVSPQQLQAGSGTAFDPRVVHAALNPCPIDPGPTPEPAFCGALTGARREDRVLYQLAWELSLSRGIAETLAAFDVRLRDVIAYDDLEVYRVEGKQLIPAYWTGEACPPATEPVAHALFRAMQTPDGPPFVVAIPLEAAGEVIAVLSLHRGSRAFHSEDQRILLAVRRPLSSALERALHQERAEQLATADPLTGLPNRRALFQRLDADLARCRRSHGTLALLVCEIHGIEQARRESGALAAHTLYKSIAAGLRQLCREDDCVARMGENFVLALGGFSPGDLPEKLRLINSLLSESALTARTGAAYYPDDGAYAEDLLACADRRLLSDDRLVSRHPSEKLRIDRFP